MSEHYSIDEELDRLRAENQRLRDALVLLADNAEAYLQLEEDGARNYPESLRLCIVEARAALAGTPSEDEIEVPPRPTTDAEIEALPVLDLNQFGTPNEDTG
jgi:hypothetical protein